MLGDDVYTIFVRCENDFVGFILRDKCGFRKLQRRGIRSKIFGLSCRVMCYLF